LQRKCHRRETTYMCFISIRSQNFLAIILCALALGKSHGDSNAYRRVDRKLKDDQQTCAATTCSSFNPDEGECNTFLDHSTTMHLWLPKFNVRKSENSTPGRFRCCVWQMSDFHLNRKAWTASTNALHQSATKTFMVKNPSRMEKSTIIDTGCSVFALGRTLWISMLWIRTTHRHSHTCNSSFNTNTKITITKRCAKTNESRHILRERWSICLRLYDIWFWSHKASHYIRVSQRRKPHIPASCDF
jgi:hypothetical protein